MEIDYRKIANHFDIVSDVNDLKTYHLSDKNRKTGEGLKKENIIKTLVFNYDADATKSDIDIARGDHFCNWWRRTQNRESVKDWFKKKYKK